MKIDHYDSEKLIDHERRGIYLFTFVAPNPHAWRGLTRWYVKQAARSASMYYEEMGVVLTEDVTDAARVKTLVEAERLQKRLPFPVEVWEEANHAFQRILPAILVKTVETIDDARAWFLPKMEVTVEYPAEIRNPYYQFLRVIPDEVRKEYKRIQAEEKNR